MSVVDMVLKKGHGYYELSPLTDAGRELVAKVKAANLSSIGTDYEGKNILLDSFFGTAGLWCYHNVLPEMTLQWGEDVFEGEEGKKALWEICA